MTNFISEIAGICKLPFSEILKDFKIIQLGKKAIYICNYKKIIDYSSEKVVLKIQGNTLEIGGKDLFISQINRGEIIIKGDIYNVGLGVIYEKDKDKK